MKTAEVLYKLSALLVTHDVPDYFRSDNGSEFTAIEIRKWLKRLGVKTLFIEPGSSPPEAGKLVSMVT